MGWKKPATNKSFRACTCTMTMKETYILFLEITVLTEMHVALFPCCNFRLYINVESAHQKRATRVTRAIDYWQLAHCRCRRCCCCCCRLTYKSKSFLESLNALNVAPSDVRTKAIHVDDAVRSRRFDTNISSFLTSAG